MASKWAIYHIGYDDDLFEHAVSSSLHCIICTNVIKDPVACRHNEHLFCRACITEHLKNHQTCPSCMDPLTVDTLSQAPRTVMNLLAELKIRCKFFDRGCGKFIELGNLDSHIRECGFAPAVCSNDGCELEVNKRDLLHHETAVCEQRRVKCHSCNDIRQQMAAMIEKLERIEANRKAVEENLIAKVELVQEQLKIQEESMSRQLNKQEESSLRLEIEMAKSLNEITKQLERMAQQASQEVQIEKELVKKGIAESAEMDGEPKVIIAGGSNGQSLSSVEMFSLSNGTWSRLQPMRESRYGASSIVYNSQVIVLGGYFKSMEKLALNAIEADQSMTWENFPAELPKWLAGHSGVVYNGQCLVIGGYVQGTYSKSITVISLVPPYARKLLASMQETRCYHGTVLFGDVIVIVGGRRNGNYNTALRTVVMFHIVKIEYEELAPLPYPVCEMAAVKWGDDNVIIIGGADNTGKALNTVLMYNVKTQKCYMLPDMKYKRKGCVAAVFKDTVIVMGGKDEREYYLKSVEVFKFDCYTWDEFPVMQEMRYRATAVVC